MAIEQELEKLHANLKALGSAREKLDVVSGNIAEVTGSVEKAGESLKRLAEMPELTERVRTSVDRLINASKDVEILNAVSSVNTAVHALDVNVQAVHVEVSRIASDVASMSKDLDKGVASLKGEVETAHKNLESYVRDAFAGVVIKQDKHSKLIIGLLVLSIVQLCGLAILALKAFQ